MTNLSRRELLATAGAATLAATAGGSSAFAQSKTLTVFGHRVHQTAATTGPGGDATADWRQKTGTNVEWVTLGDVNAIHERLLREATLGQTTLDVAYLLNGRAIPRNLALFEPLDNHMKSSPIERFDDFAKGLVDPFKLNGAVTGIPVRHATNALIYNEAIFEERKVAIPKTFEELMEAARKLTFRRDDGTQVYGLAFTPVFASNFLTLTRCLGGDYMSVDGKVTCAEPGMVKGVAAFAAMFKDGVLPRNTPTLNNEEIVTWMQQGRAAMTINPYARLAPFNDPKVSKYPGKLKPLLPPMSQDLAGKVAFAPTVEFWSLVIPKNARDKAASYSFIQALSSPASTLAMALNGNGPTRISTYDDAKFKAGSPFAADEAKAVAASRIHLPAFDEQTRAHDIFVEETQAAMIGNKAADKAMADAASRVAPLVKM